MMSARGNNKALGAAFERQFCRILSSRGYWVHFISPSPSGGQPFDVIAVKDGVAYAFDCKTSIRKSFPYSRLEENQILAFEKWVKCGNTEPRIAVLYGDIIYLVPYMELKEKGVVELEKGYSWCSVM